MKKQIQYTEEIKIKKNSKLVFWLRRIVARLTVVLAFFSLLIFLENLHWIIALFSHFRIQYLVISAILLLLSWIAQLRGFVFLNALLLLFNAWIVVSSLDLHKQSISSKSNFHELKIFSANVHSRNRDASKLRDLINNISPDVVVLLEVNRWWARELNSLEAHYPFMLKETREDNFGISIYSRVKLNKSKIEFFRNDIPFIEAYLGETTVRLIAVHTLPPISGEYKVWRDEQMSLIAHKTRTENFPTIIIGDFNDTPWTPNFKKFLKDSQTKMAGIDLLGRTWPVNLWPLGLHLDHAFVKGVVVDRFEVLNSVGSDHYPIALTLLIDSKKEGVD